MRKIYLLTFLLYFWISLPAQDKIAYDTLFNRVSKLPSDEVIRLGDNYLKKEYTDTAIVLYSIAFSRFNDEMTEAEQLLCATSYRKTANIYYLQGNYTNALELYIKGLKICESCKKKNDIPRFYSNIGSVYCAFQDYEKGMNYYEEGYRLCSLYPNSEVEYNLLTNMSGIYSYLKNNEKAKIYYWKAERIRQPNDVVKKYMSLLNWGLILVNEGRYSKAVHYFKQTVDFARKNKMEPRYECSSYEELYKVYTLINNNDSTMHYLRLCNQMAVKNGLKDILVQSLKRYSILYESKGDIRNSLYYKGKYLSLTDSIFNLREFNRIKNLQFLYEVEKTSKEISTLNAEKEKKEQKIRVQRIILASILPAFVIISGLLMLVYMQKRKIQATYRNLFNMNRIIVASEKYNKELRVQYEEKLSKYSQIYGESVLLPHDEKTEEQTDYESKAKYQASNLTEEQGQVLLNAINKVMKTTSEFCQEDFSLEKLATLVNSNSKYVSQVINETYQKNFSDFINEYRIAEARCRLMDAQCYGNYTIQAIAESVGYKSQSTFIRAFRKITGIPPSIYQKMAQEKNISFFNS